MKLNNYDYKHSSIIHDLSNIDIKLSTIEAEALHFILPLSHDYPDIQSWYYRKVVPGLRCGTRFLLRIERNNKLVGIGIAKRENGERKICTVRVAPEQVGRGMGLRIFDGLMHWLDDDAPHLSVSSNKISSFERIFDHYGFNLTTTQNGLYVPGHIEFGYNGTILDQSSTCIKSTPK